MDLLGEPAVTQPDQGRRSLRSANKRTPARPGAAGRVRQSPVVRAGRRKATVSTVVQPKEIAELAHPPRPLNGLDVPRSRDTSETDSISPEPLLSEMRPPPKPGSVTQSPAMMAQQYGQGAVPATPASLMRIHPSPNFGGPMDTPPVLEDLTLPEASLDRPTTSRSNTVVRDDGEDTPRLSARKMPKLSPLGTPGAYGSSQPSPMLDGGSTPTSPAVSLPNGKKADLKTRNVKKRNSVSSNLVSPALRPKISTLR